MTLLKIFQKQKKNFSKKKIFGSKKFDRDFLNAPNYIFFRSLLLCVMWQQLFDQKNLKFLKLSAYYSNFRRDICKNPADMIPALTKHTDTLTKLHLYIDGDILPLSLVSLFLNLQEILFDGMQFNDFKKLQYVTLPKLQTLKISY